MQRNRKVEIVEVFPRDGLQGWPSFIDTDAKVQIINYLSQSGVSAIEVTSFVHPKVVPNLSDAEKVMRQIDRYEDVNYQVLVPNKKGAERALVVQPNEIVGLITSSETYNKKNQNMTIDENIRQLEEIVTLASDQPLKISAAVGCCFYCPFEGRIELPTLMNTVSKIVALGINKVTIADTMGLANPNQIKYYFSELIAAFPDITFTYHLHNLNGFGLANVMTAYEVGIYRFETALHGIGGGIAAPENLSSGNIPTEDVVNFFNEMSIETGVDLKQLKQVADISGRLIELQNPLSYYMNYINKI